MYSIRLFSSILFIIVMMMNNINKSFGMNQYDSNLPLEIVYYRNILTFTIDLINTESKDFIQESLNQRPIYEWNCNHFLAQSTILIRKFHEKNCMNIVNNNNNNKTQYLSNAIDNNIDDVFDKMNYEFDFFLDNGDDDVDDNNGEEHNEHSADRTVIDLHHPSQYNKHQANNDDYVNSIDCGKLSNNLNYFLHYGTNQCMNENVGNNLPLKCIDLQEYYEEISDQFKQNQCHYQQSGKIKSSTSICSEIKYLGELIRFVYFYNCIQLQQYRQQQHHQQQKQQQQLQSIERHKRYLSNDFDSKRRRKATNNNQNNNNQNNNDKSFYDWHSFTCDFLTERSLLLSNDYKQSNCPKSIADKQTTRKCLKIRRELYLILHFATDKCIDAQLYDYQFDVRCQRLSKHIEKFQNEMKKFSCPNNQFSTLPGPYASNSYVSYSYVINSYVSICPELRFLKNLVQYKHYHDCIQKWKIDRLF